MIRSIEMTLSLAIFLDEMIREKRLMMQVDEGMRRDGETTDEMRKGEMR